MRVAFVVGTFPELSETFVLDQIAGLIDHGHEVVVFGRAPAAGAQVHPVVREYNLQTVARYWVRGGHTPLDTLRRTRTLWRADAPRCAAVMRACLDARRHGWLSVSGALWAYASCALTESEPFDVIVAHFGNNGILAQKLKEVGALRGPLVTVFHGHDLSQKLRKHGSGMYRDLFGGLELALPVSQYFADRLVALGCDPEKVRVHHMGVDTTEFRMRARTRGAGEPVQLLSVCRLVEKKGIEMGLRAAARAARDSQVPFVWHIVGDGPLRGRLAALVRSLELEVHVQFHGPRTRDEVRHLLDTCHLFVAPSVTASDGNQEGIPVAIMEAAACGLPVLSTRHSGISELVKDGVSGYLVDEWDVAALGARMVELFERPERWAEMGMQGRRTVEAEFDERALNAEFQRLLSQFTPAPTE